MRNREGWCERNKYLHKAFDSGFSYHDGQFICQARDPTSPCFSVKLTMSKFLSQTFWDIMGAMKSLKILFISICLSACSSLKNEEAFNQHLANQECEKALIENQPSSSMEILSTTAQGTGTVASYLLTGLGYTTDFVVQFGGGIGVGIIICSPLIALELGARGDGRISGECVANVSSPIVEAGNFMKLGKTSHKRTRTWRCPNYDKLSEGFRKVARCHYDRGEIQKSRQQILRLKTDTSFFGCLSNDEQQKIDQEFDLYSR